MRCFIFTQRLRAARLRRRGGRGEAAAEDGDEVGREGGDAVGEGHLLVVERVDCAQQPLQLALVLYGGQTQRKTR